MLQDATTAAPVTSARTNIRRDEIFWAYVFLLPWIVGLIVFVLGPMLFSLGLSFTNYSLGRDFVFTGLENWNRAFFKDELFWPSAGRTLLYAAIIVPLGVAGALATAMLLNQGLRFTIGYRTLFFLPHLAPTVAAVYIWLMLLNAKFGLVNEVIWQLSHREGPSWFGDTFWALPAVMLISLWGIIGGNMMLIFLAGLQGIPQELYEVASIDGANTWSRFWNVTLPMISPTLFFNSVLALIGALQVFETAYIGTQGGPAYATWFYGLHIYQTAFQFFELGYASSLAWIFFIALSIFTYIQFRASRNWVYYAGEAR